MKDYAVFISLIFLLCGFLFFGYTVQVSADQTSLSVDPAIIDTGGEPGQLVASEIRITNQSESFRPILLSARPLLLSQPEGDPSGTVIRNADTWISFDTSEFILSPGEQKVVSVQLRIPESAGPGGHYADILVRALVLDEPGRLTTALPEVAVTTLVTVTGDIVENHKTALIGGLFRIVSSTGQSPLVSYEVSNEGNVHSLFAPSLSITAENGAVYSVDNEPTVLLPGESETIVFSLPEEITSGFHWAELDYSYGSPAQAVDSQRSELLIVPFSLYWLILPAIGLFSFVMYRYRNRIQKALRILIKGV